MVDDISLMDGPFVIAVYVVTGVLAAVLVALRIRTGARGGARRIARVLGVGIAVGALVGGLLTWLLGDVWNVFEISLTWVVRITSVIGFAVLGYAIGEMILGRLLRRLLSPVLAVLTLVAMAMTINIDFAAFRTVGDLLGHNGITPLTEPVAAATGDLASWTPPAGMPSRGVVKSVQIPAVTAKFSPRDAVVYLPPAALVENPPPLPVVVALSGQPGGPTDLITSGQLNVFLDGIAAAHNGLAPIMVVPDQLQRPETNPMCVDGPIGQAATYLTADVPTWILANLPVTTDHSRWTIAGYSEGGTCAIQLGAGHPELFGSLIDISGELVPSIGNEADTIAQGFGGDRAAYLAATPAEILKAHAPYTDYPAYFTSGSEDPIFGPYIDQVSALAAQAGMTVTREVSHGTAHDWNTAKFGFQHGFTMLLPKWGIASE